MPMVLAGTSTAVEGFAPKTKGDALALIRRGDILAAAELLAQALTQPSCTRDPDFLCFCAGFLGRNPRLLRSHSAAALIRTAFELAEAPDEREKIVQLACQAARHCKDRDIGIAIYNVVVDYSPHNVVMLCARATALRDRGNRFNDALEGFRSALRLEPQNPRALIGLVSVYCQRERFTEAEAFLRAERSKLPENPAVLCALGEVLIALGREGNAEILWQSGLAEGRMDQRQTYLHAFLAWHHIRNGDLDRAKRSLQPISIEPRPYCTGEILAQLHLEALGQIPQGLVLRNLLQFEGSGRMHSDTSRKLKRQGAGTLELLRGDLREHSAQSGASNRNGVSVSILRAPWESFLSLVATAVSGN